MKKILSILSLLLIAVAAQAQYIKSINLWTDDGTNVTFNLSRSLVIRFDENNLIASDNQQQISISLDKVKINYSNYASAIDTPEASQGPSFENGTLVFRGLQASQTVRVYSLDGKLLMTAPANEEVVLPLSALPKGTSIIQAGQYSMKYHRK